MTLFQFKLARVENVVPWGQPGNRSLSWFALTDGQFWMPVGEQVLFEYTEELSTHRARTMRAADYQIAAFARDILGCVAAAVAPLPPRIERLASDWQLLMTLAEPIDDDSENTANVWYNAFRWLGDRTPYTGYLLASPTFQFVRIGDEMRVHWDNRQRFIDGIPVWTAGHGMHAIPVKSFRDHCSGFASRLLAAMEERISGIENGTMRPQIELNISSLREQHEEWRAEFASYLRDQYQPDIPWQETENALLTIAEEKGIHL